MPYAETTIVSVSRTRSEIEELLLRKGATQFAYMLDGNKAVIGFAVNSRRVRFVVPLPDRTDKKFFFTPARRNRRSDDEAFQEWEQACRSRWRALYLAIKAKLESVEIGIATFEEEFLAHFVCDDGQTIGEKVIPQIDSNIKGQILLSWIDPIK